MITAKEAKQLTDNRLNQLAKEYVLNYAQTIIRKAIGLGRYSAVLDFVNTKMDLHNIEVVGPEIVKLLEAQGFEAEFYMSDGYRYEAQVTVRWGDKR